MTQKTINIFQGENYFKALKKIYISNKTDVHRFDDTCLTDMLDSVEYGTKNKKSYRYVLIVIDSCSKFVWTIPLKIKNSQTITNSFKKSLKLYKRKSNLIGTDRGKHFVGKIYTNLLNKDKGKTCSLYTSLGAIFAESFTLIIRDLLERPIFEEGDASWIDKVPKRKTKQNKNKIQSSTNITPIKASLKKNEGYVHSNLLDKIKKVKPNYKILGLVRTADFKKTISKGDTMNGS